MAAVQKPKRVLFLMSHTGGGHRAAAEAVQTAMELLYPETYTYEMVDVFQDYTPFPFRAMPDVYPRWVNMAGFSWKWGYKLINTPILSEMILDSFYLTWRQGLIRLFDEHPADVIICVHSMFNRAALRVLHHYMDNPPPFVTIVTDLVSTPVFWYQPSADMCIVPTLWAYERGLAQGMAPEQMKLIGLPIHPEFVNALVNKQEARQDLGWGKDKIAVLLVSGGEGMGPVYQIARAINDKNLDIQLAIVTGHNHKLKAKLEACQWNQPTFIYAFIAMPQFMSAADILITKAGPATISEACVAGLPMIISGFVPGQENGNVDFVVENGAGVYAPTAHQVASVLSQWVNSPPMYRQVYADAAKSLGRPRAAWETAQEIHVLLQESSQATQA